MANLGGLVGTAGGANGTGFAGPTDNGLISPGQLQTGYDTAQNSLHTMAGLVAAIQAQNGLQNQSNVYNQLQGVVNGTGPNPAQAMLNQATGANIVGQASLMAGQRGSSANPGLVARNAARAGGDINQQSAGQAATMQANQSLNALNAAGNIAGQQVGNQIGATQGYMQGAENEQMGVLNSAAGLQANVNNANAGLVGATMGQQASIGSSMSKSMGSMMGMGAEGGKPEMMPRKMAAGGGLQFQNTPGALQIDANGPLSSVGQYFSQIANIDKGGPAQVAAVQQPKTTSGTEQPWDMGGGVDHGDVQQNTPDNSPGVGVEPTFVAAYGGKVPVMLSKGEKVVAPKDVRAVAAGKKSPMSAKTVPGKPKHPGNDYRNDVVPADLPEGAIVIPNKILQGKSPHWAAMRFVQAHMAQGGMVGLKSSGLTSKKKKK